MTVRTAVVGLGWWGREHVRAMTGSSKMEIVLLADPNLDLVAPFAEEHGLPLVPDLDTVLSNERVDAVILATPHDQHTDQVIRAAEAGKHAFVEKPFALSGDAAREQVRICEKSGVQLGIGLIQRFLEPHRKLKAMLDTGQLGTPMHAEASTSHDVLLNIDSWRKDPVQAPAGGLHHTGTHLIDLLVWMLGPVSRVHAVRASHVFDHDTAAVLLIFAAGQTATVSNVMATADHRYFHVLGSEGWARRISDTELVVRSRGREVAAIQFDPSNELRVNNESFADAVMRINPYPISTADMIHNVDVLDAIVASMDSGASIEVREHPDVR